MRGGQVGTELEAGVTNEQGARFAPLRSLPYFRMVGDSCVSVERRTSSART